jgi:hypothetical protein
VGAAAVGVAVGAGLVGLGLAVGFAVAVGVNVGVGLGVGVAATSGDGADAGELATAELAASLSVGLTGFELSAPALAALAALVRTAGEPTEDVFPADDGWLLVQAANAAAQRTAIVQRAGVGLVVRSRLAITPG